MNRKMTAYLLGILLIMESALLLLPCIVALIYREPSALHSFLLSALSALVAGGALMLIAHPKDKTIYPRDGFVVVALGWLLTSLFGALPFFISGAIPNYLDAVFEAVSGFTTTGASILPEVESLMKSILFWRSFTHWIGGMGVLVFIMAVMPLAGGGGNLHLMRAESPGPDVSKLVPKSRRTARILYGIYLGMTIVQVILLLCGGENLFDSMTLSFGTAGTGGFGIRNDSLASFSSYTQIVVTVFMALFGINFNLYFLLLCKKFGTVLKSEELRAYFAIMAGAVFVVFLNVRGLFDGAGEALRAAAFQVTSVMTTTGYTTANFDEWPELSRIIMLLIMCVGTCAGSTGGGIKVSRILLLMKSAKREIRKMLHPRRVEVITFDKKKVNNAVLENVSVFFAIYIMIFVVSVIIVSFDRQDMITNVSGVIATLNNIGPGLGTVGAIGNYSTYSALSKIVFILDMLLGRLEIFPLLLLITPYFTASGRKFLLLRRKKNASE